MREGWAVAQRTETFRVEGMTCEGCRAAVARVLERTPGVARAEVDLEGASATVTYDPARVTPEALAEAVRRAGYALAPA